MINGVFLTHLANCNSMLFKFPKNITRCLMFKIHSFVVAQAFGPQKNCRRGLSYLTKGVCLVFGFLKLENNQGFFQLHFGNDVNNL